MILAVIVEIEREVKVGSTQGLDDSLQIIFAITGNADGFALDLRFCFREALADQPGNFFGLILGQAFLEGDSLGGFKVIFGNFVTNVEQFLALTAAGKLFTDNFDNGFNLPLATAGQLKTGLIGIEPLNIGRGALKVIATRQLSLGLVKDVVHLCLVVLTHHIK